MADLCLGTVQFGMKYGINNTLGQPTWEQSFSMLDVAIDNGITIIDTARAYGEAELILGEYFQCRNNTSKVRIISKLRPNILEDKKKIEQTVINECKGSLQRLHMEQLEGYLLHTPEYIYNEDILAALQKLKSDQYVNKIGVSIYDIKEGIAAIETGIVDYIQLPYSILDQRGVKTGFIKKAKAAGITVFTRSAFLQGLFMMEKEHIPPYVRNSIPYIEIFHSLIKKYEIDRVSALLHFVKQEKEIDYLVFGVDTKEQLLEDIKAFREKDIEIEFINDMKKQMADVDKSIIFPSLWSNGKKAQ